MRAFVLCAGRSGSTTFAKACGHMSNFSAGHETNAKQTADRLDYPDFHVAVDNRLSWFTGMLDEQYGDSVVYCHLTRNPDLVARSYARRFGVRAGIAPAFASGVIRRTRLPQTEADRLAACRLMVEAVTANISLFLRDKSRVVVVDIDDPHEPFDEFWGLLGAEGDLDAAHATLATVHNATRPDRRLR